MFHFHYWTLNMSLGQFHLKFYFETKQTLSVLLIESVPNSSAHVIIMLQSRKLHTLDSIHYFFIFKLV
jgi:hypothetical protein